MAIKKGPAPPAKGDPATGLSAPLSANVDVTGRFAYVVNHGSNDVSAYVINSTTGALTAVAGSPFRAGTQPRFVQLEPSGKFVYVANAGSNEIWTYTLNSVSGALRLTARGKVRARQAPVGIGFLAGSSQVTYTPKFAYVANCGSPCGGRGEGVSGYAINATSGALTPVPGSPFSAGKAPQSVAVAPGGKFAYVLNPGDNTVSGYTINASTGALTPIPGSPFATGAFPVSVAVDPSGRFAYVSNFRDSDVSGYTINAFSGALTPVPGSPFATPISCAGRCSAQSVSVDPTGSFIYVASQDPKGFEGFLLAYAISAATGALTLIPGSPFAGGSSPGTVAVHPLGRFAYVASLDLTGVASIWVYTINANSGALTPIPGSPFAVELATEEISVDPVGKFAYTGNYLDGSISGYTINAFSGALTPISGSPFAIGGTRLVVDPSGKFAYHPNGDNTVSGYTINASTGALTLIPGSPFAAGSNPGGIAVSGQIH